MKLNLPSLIYQFIKLSGLVIFSAIIKSTNQHGSSVGAKWTVEPAEVF